MHFRSRAMAFTYMACMLMKFVDLKKVRLDEKLSAFVPNLQTPARDC